MAEYIFSGKTFRFPEKITNERVISVVETSENAKRNAWYLDRECIPLMMRALLDGPHEEMDWMKEEMPACVQVYNDFFPYVTEKARPSVNS